jgi:hypothetical protein
MARAAEVVDRILPASILRTGSFSMPPASE